MEAIKKSVISLIVATDNNFGIGINNSMPWHLPDDFKYFKQHTLGKPIVMGRKTFESIGSKPLAGRDNYVLTRNNNFNVKNVICLSSIDDFLNHTQSPEIMVIGGEQIYKLFYPMADKIYLTKVDTEVKADSFFPKTDYNDWHEVSRTYHPKDDKHAFTFDFVVLKRKLKSK